MASVVHNVTMHCDLLKDGVQKTDCRDKSLKYTGLTNDEQKSVGLTGSAVMFISTRVYGQIGE